MNKYKKMKRIKITEESKDKEGFIIPKDTEALVELEIKNPNTNKDEMIILIANGTELPELYPKALVQVEDIKYTEIESRVKK